jgi:hypothetical protein
MAAVVCIGSMLELLTLQHINMAPYLDHKIAVLRLGCVFLTKFFFFFFKEKVLHMRRTSISVDFVRDLNDLFTCKV